jgi:uncharacterized protein (TIGR02145 family)
MQLASAYYGVNVTYPNGNTPPTASNYRVQGICPNGWHLPSGGTTNTASEFVALYAAVGSSRSNLNNSWKPVLSGDAVPSGTLERQGVNGYWWSSTERDNNYVYNLGVSTSDVNPPTNGRSKYSGLSVRCVKD